MLNISELTKIKEKKRKYWKRKYDEVLEKCHKRIKYYAKHGYEECLFEVPSSVFGLPVYDINECMHYIVLKLKRNGLDLKILGNALIYISWKQYAPKEPQYVISARQIKEAERRRLLPPPQKVIVQQPMTVNQSANKPNMFSPKDYFNPRLKPVVAAMGQRYALPSDSIPQRNMAEPLISHRPKTTRSGRNHNTQNIQHSHSMESEKPKKRGRPKKTHTEEPKKPSSKNVNQPRIAFI